MMALIALVPWQAKAETKPNVLVLVANDLRADIVGRQVAGVALTPTLEALSKRSAAFTNTYCPGTTAKERGVCRRAALFSGRSPLHAKAAQPGDLTTMPSYFKSLAYSTAFVGETHENDRAFESQFESTIGIKCDPSGGDNKADQEITDAVIEHTKKSAGAKPWLVWVGFSSVACPPDVPFVAERASPPSTDVIPVNFNDKAPGAYVVDQGRERAVVAVEEVVNRWGAYITRVHDLDQQVDRILKSLRESGQMDRTIIVFVSNNGVEIGCHGLVGNDNVYEETIRVPLFISGKGVRPGVNDSLVSLTDVLPTLIEMTGGDVPLLMDGHSLTPVLSGERSRVRTSMFLSHRDQIRAMRDERWKLIVHRIPGTVELYDLHADPFEMHDLSPSGEHIDRIGSMLVAMQQWQRSMGDFLDLPKVSLAGSASSTGGN